MTANEATCSVCDKTESSSAMTTWRDGDGEGWWVHRECAGELRHPPMPAANAEMRAER